MGMGRRPSFMKILIAPFARKLRGPAGPNAKDYPFILPLLSLLKEHDLTQIGAKDDEHLPIPGIFGLSFKEVCESVKTTDTFISVDSYLQHIGWYVGKPGIVLFGPSDPLIFGHNIHINLLRNRKYLRAGWREFSDWESCPLCPQAFVSPEEVVKALEKLNL